LHDPKNIRLAKKAIRLAFETQARGLGFSMVELLSTCPTNWGMTPVDSLKFVEQHMVPAFPLGDYKVTAGVVRGGTANCTVVIADEEIGSPLVKNPPLAIALNLPSLDKCEETLAPGGTLIVNQSMVDRAAKRQDINVIFVPCNEIAEELGNKKLLNMVAVGALLTVLPEISLKDVGKALEGHLPARYKHLLPQNYEALRRGFEAASKVLA
jgi:2-oxoglutarate ferredoxin oxidoreductase subunit gamma